MLIVSNANMLTALVNPHMKILHFPLAIAAAVLFVGCAGKADENTPLRVLSLGEPVTTNPLGLDHCKPAESADVLKSLHRIDDKFYYMDYTIDLQLDSLIDKDLRNMEDFNLALHSILFNEPEKEDFGDINALSCSGFACKNPSGQTLFGRNFDGGAGPLLLTFNTANGYRFVASTNPIYNSMKMYFDPEKGGDGVLNNGKAPLYGLLRQPFATVDGMNEYGLCFGAFQLPTFGGLDKKFEPNPDKLQQETGKKALGIMLMHSCLLGKCKTIREAEEFLRAHDMVNPLPLNVHWLMADATGDWAIFEYWKNELYVYRDKELYDLANHKRGQHNIQWEWYSIENYYRHPEPYLSFPVNQAENPANWQQQMTNKRRVEHMMNFYHPIMTEMEALECLQEGHFGIEELGGVTDWSMVFNPAERTILFNMRNDMSTIYTLDLKKDLGW